MCDLIPHTKANREFFAIGCAPTKCKWLDWISRGVVRGKIIDGSPYIDANWFAANDCMMQPQETKTTAMDLLR